MFHLDAATGGHVADHLELRTHHAFHHLPLGGRHAGHLGFKFLQLFAGLCELGFLFRRHCTTDPHDGTERLVHVPAAGHIPEVPVFALDRHLPSFAPVGYRAVHREEQWNVLLRIHQHPHRVAGNLLRARGLAEIQVVGTQFADPPALEITVAHELRQLFDLLGVAGVVGSGAGLLRAHLNFPLGRSPQHHCVHRRHVAWVCGQPGLVRWRIHQHRSQPTRDACRRHFALHPLFHLDTRLLDGVCSTQQLAGRRVAHRAAT